MWPIMFVNEKLALIPGLCRRPCLQQLLTPADRTSWKRVYKNSYLVENLPAGCLAHLWDFLPLTKNKYLQLNKTLH